MRPPRVHQFTAVLAGRDAIGGHVLQLHELLEELGAETGVYAAHVHPGLNGIGRDYRSHADGPPPDVVLYQASTGTPVGEYVLTLPAPLVVDYHNMTPAEFFDPWEPHVGAELDHGRRQLARLARRATLGLADSAFNAAELRAVGCVDVRVAPILMERPGSGVDRAGLGPVVERLRGRVGSGPVWLFVGRVAPNKAQHDLVAAFAVYRDLFAADARLVLVGGSSSGSYSAALDGLISSLGLSDSVVVAGSVGEEELAGWYSVADVFVCVSEHEGFCVPLLESMAFGVPVVAFSSSAVPETVGGAGLVVGDKSPVVVAEAVDRVVSDPVVAGRLVDRGAERLADFDISVTSEIFRTALAPLLEAL